MLKQNKIKQVNLLKKIRRRLKKKYKKKLQIPYAKLRLNTKRNVLSELIIIRELIKKMRIKNEVKSIITKNILNKFAKSMIYFFARHYYFKKHAFRVMQRIRQKQRILLNNLNVNTNIYTKSTFNN